MKKRSFDDALAAMRETEGVPTDQLAAIRRELLADNKGAARARASSRRRPASTALLLAAALGGTAFAASNAHRWQSAPRRAQEPARTTATRAIEAPVHTPTPVRRAPPSLIPAPVVAAPSTEAAPRVRARNTQRIITQSATTTAVTPVANRASADDALYLSAHDAHFAQHDDQLALDRWEQYLAAQPRGRFAPEAQFNRVVCLARLNRRSEALAAIAALPAGHYRASELDRLRAHLEGAQRAAQSP